MCFASSVVNILLVRVLGRARYVHLLSVALGEQPPLDQTLLPLQDIKKYYTILQPPLDQTLLPLQHIKIYYTILQLPLDLTLLPLQDVKRYYTIIQPPLD